MSMISDEKSGSVLGTVFSLRLVQVHFVQTPKSSQDPAAMGPHISHSPTLLLLLLFFITTLLLLL